MLTLYNGHANDDAQTKNGAGKSDQAYSRSLKTRLQVADKLF